MTRLWRALRWAVHKVGYLAVQIVDFLDVLEMHLDWRIMRQISRDQKRATISIKQETEGLAPEPVVTWIEAADIAPGQIVAIDLRWGSATSSPSEDLRAGINMLMGDVRHATGIDAVGQEPQNRSRPAHGGYPDWPTR